MDTGQSQKVSPIRVLILLCVPLTPVPIICLDPKLGFIAIFVYPCLLVFASIVTIAINKLTAWPKPAVITRQILLCLNAALLAFYIYTLSTMVTHWPSELRP